MLFITFLIFLAFSNTIHSQSWNTSGEISPWESYFQLGDIQRPLGLTVNRSSLAHHHFYIGYLCLHSFMYDEAQAAFDLAINIDHTFIEPYIGKMLGCKQSLWYYTNFTCGKMAYNTTEQMLNSTNRTFSYLQLSLVSIVYQWYANESDTAAGELAFLSSIANLSQTYPNETDIRVLYGLSLLNVAKQAQYQSEMEPPKMVESRGVLKTALEYEPYHPGAIHYLIHAYDVVQVNISEQATGYASLYGNISKTSSHAQHMPAHIWMRIGSWSRAVSADNTGIIASLTLCATKLLGRIVSISSTQLEPVLNLFNITNQTLLMFCDAENRAHSSEWLSYTRLQTGDWSGSVAVLRDLFIADNKSTLTPNHYLPFAYRTQAHTIVDLFFWFPYNYQFLNRTQQLLALNGTNSLVLMGDNATRWSLIWSEAGVRFSECLRLLTDDNNTSNNTLEVNNHLDHLAILSNQAMPLNQYISISISMMILQISGIRYYVNQSWQECLNELNNATQREATLVPDANTPTLIFARSSELLAMHLLLIHKKSQEQSGKSAILSTYTLNDTNVSINEFPTRALSLYRIANLTGPNRAINTLGMARSNLQSGNTNQAVNLYQALLIQMNSSNDSDPIFLQEPLNIIIAYNSATTNKPFILSSIFIFCIFYN